MRGCSEWADSCHLKWGEHVPGGRIGMGSQQPLVQLFPVTGVPRAWVDNTKWYLYARAARQPGKVIPAMYGAGRHDHHTLGASRTSLWIDI